MLKFRFKFTTSTAAAAAAKKEWMGLDTTCLERKIHHDHHLLLRRRRRDDDVSFYMYLHDVSSREFKLNSGEVVKASSFDLRCFFDTLLCAVCACWGFSFFFQCFPLLMMQQQRWSGVITELMMRLLNPYGEDENLSLDWNLLWKIGEHSIAIHIPSAASFLRRSSNAVSIKETLRYNSDDMEMIISLSRLLHTTLWLLPTKGR